MLRVMCSALLVCHCPYAVLSSLEEDVITRGRGEMGRLVSCDLDRDQLHSTSGCCVHRLVVLCWLLLAHRLLLLLLRTGAVRVRI